MEAAVPRSLGMKHCLPLLLLLCACATPTDRVAQDVTFQQTQRAH